MAYFKISFGAVLKSEPSKAVIISLREVSNLAIRLFEGSGDCEDCGGQTETKSPPGPNLHTGSVLLFRGLAIFKDPRYKTNIFYYYCKYFYR
jgi:hypothetical protein